MNPRVSQVIPTDDYKLELLFTDGGRRVYDCLGILDFGVFQELRDKNYFKQVTVVHGTAVWPHEQDICPDTLYLDSVEVEAAHGAAPGSPGPAPSPAGRGLG